ncbi:MAG TPA: hypothetical protein PLQ88_03135, partial [Blastocatellia bacterium]|nr:hypothetical protein [Blastocatellia bacterium]
TRRLDADTAIELIPLAVYGLEHPRFPALLADFRDRRNPNRREASGRIIQDFSRIVLRISPFRSLPLWLGQRAFNFVINRRNADFNQPSRMRAYAQLDLLLATDNTLDPRLRDAIAQQVYGRSSTPLQVKAAFAREHYTALLAALRKGQR